MLKYYIHITKCLNYVNQILQLIFSFIYITSSRRHKQTSLRLLKAKHRLSHTSVSTYKTGSARHLCQLSKDPIGHPAEVKSSSVIVFTKKQLFRLRYVAVALGSFQMLTGIDAIIMYASDILAKEFNSYRIGILGSVALGVVNMSTVLVAAQLVSRFDRRKMLLIGIIGVSACNIGIAICYLLQPVNELLLLILMLLFQIFYCSGPEPIVFMFFSEMFPNEHKNQLSSLGYGANWLTNIIVVFTFQFFEGRLWILYFIYAGATLILGISGTVLAPETRGKSLDEIEAIIAKW
ncbi:Hexose_transporter [Hexamita inflata]|uniref:Hexose transporter n=1 Tax=Hexamita inflata TaxID=28002 RepID=A0AA86QYA0_9EUKA|nr:Hexose transporter [Hexamita inflata]